MIRVGLVGFGMAGRVFHGPLLSSVEGLELAAVMERSTNKAAERYPGITSTARSKRCWPTHSLGLFVVATPNGTHFALAKEILSAGKNVVVDKPMTLTSAEAAELIGLARKQNTLLAPFHNRRWDSDFLTVQKLLHEGSLGRLVAFESRFDRWRPAPHDRSLVEGERRHRRRQAARSRAAPCRPGAGALRQAGGCERRRAARERRPRSERRLYHSSALSGSLVTLGANSLSLPAAPRFHLRGTKGNYWKFGVDPQEAALNKITRIADPAWGREPEKAWGVLHVGHRGRDR